MDTPEPEPERERGLSDRFRDWRHRRSRSRASQEASKPEQPPIGREPKSKPAGDANDLALDINKLNLQDGMQAAPSLDATNAPSGLTATGFPTRKMVQQTYVWTA